MQVSDYCCFSLRLVLGRRLRRGLHFLSSPPVQQAIYQAFQSSGISSLPAEREFAVVKRNEAPRLCHVATASRNQILRHFLRQRNEMLHQAELAAAALRRSLQANVASLAWELRPSFSDTALTKPEQSGMKEFISANRVTLTAEVQRRRAFAKATLDRVQHQDGLLTKTDWIRWFRRHYDEFYQHMQTACTERRATNRRMHAAADVPVGVARLAPARSASSGSQASGMHGLLAGRSGWFLIRHPTQASKLYFVHSMRRQTYFMDFSSFRRGREW